MATVSMGIAEIYNELLKMMNHWCRHKRKGYISIGDYKVYCRFEDKWIDNRATYSLSASIPNNMAEREVLMLLKAMDTIKEKNNIQLVVMNDLTEVKKIKDMNGYKEINHELVK